MKQKLIAAVVILSVILAMAVAFLIYLELDYAARVLDVTEPPATVAPEAERPTTPTPTETEESEKPTPGVTVNPDVADSTEAVTTAPTETEPTEPKTVPTEPETEPTEPSHSRDENETPIL